MKNVFVTVVDKPCAVDRFVVSVCAFANRNGFDPVDRILQPEIRPRALQQIEWGIWLRGFAANVEEQGSMRLQRARRRAEPFPRPTHILMRRKQILIDAVIYADVIRRRCHNDINAFSRKAVEQGQSVYVIQLVGFEEMSVKVQYAKCRGYVHNLPTNPAHRVTGTVRGYGYVAAAARRQSACRY